MASRKYASPGATTESAQRKTPAPVYTSILRTRRARANLLARKERAKTARTELRPTRQGPATVEPEAAKAPAHHEARKLSLMWHFYATIISRASVPTATNANTTTTVHAYSSRRATAHVETIASSPTLLLQLPPSSILKRKRMTKMLEMLARGMSIMRKRGLIPCYLRLTLGTLQRPHLRTAK